MLQIFKKEHLFLMYLLPVDFCVKQSKILGSAQHFVHHFLVFKLFLHFLVVWNLIQGSLPCLGAGNLGTWKLQGLNHTNV